MNAFTLESPYARRNFEKIVRYARRSNPFYRRWINDVNDVPVVDRRTYLAHNDEILNGTPHTAATSGSTGVPVRLAKSARREAMDAEDNRRYAEWIGGLRRGIYIVVPRRLDPPQGVVDIAKPTSEQVELILSHRESRKIEAITTYPTNALILAEAVIREGLDMRFVQQFGMYGEAVDDSVLDALSEAFPEARVWTTYSSVEFGLIAARCPYNPDYHHVMAHKLGLEVVDANGNACRPGQVGRVVITDYYNEASPFVRYDIGDLAEPGVCPCGRIRLPALRRIHGKVYNALVDRSGERRPAAALTMALHQLPGMIQYQVIQDSAESFTIRLVTTQNVEAGVRRELSRFLGYEPAGVTFAYVESIPRMPNGKFFATVCRVESNNT